jgi:hypothetical protein
MKKKLIMSLAMLVFICLFTPIVSAQSPYWVSSYSYIQHRVYEDGRDFYRMIVAVSNQQNCPSCYVPDANIIDHVVIWASEDGVNFSTYGAPIAGADMKLSHEDVAYPYYWYAGAGPSVWNYPYSGGKLFYNPGNEYYFLYDLKEPFPDGWWFYFEVFTTDHQVAESLDQTNWPKRFMLHDLPMIKAHTIKNSWDKDGNLLITWDAPYTFNPPEDFPDVFSTQTRLFIILENNPPYMKYLLCAMPTHLGGWFVPNSIVDQLGVRKVDLQLHIRTTDNCNRVYSEVKTIKLK